MENIIPINKKSEELLKIAIETRTRKAIAAELEKDNEKNVTPESHIETEIKNLEDFLGKMMAGIINVTIDQIYAFRKELTPDNQKDFDNEATLNQQKQICFVYSLNSDEIITIKNLTPKNLNIAFLNELSVYIDLLYQWTGEEKFLCNHIK